MTSKKDRDELPAMAHASRGEDLLGRTLRMVAILVGACVLFVGSLSFAALAITSKVTGAAGANEIKEPAPAAPSRPAPPRTGTDAKPI